MMTDVALFGGETFSYIERSYVWLWYSITLAWNLTDRPSRSNLFISQSIGPWLIEKNPSQSSAANSLKLELLLIKKRSYAGIGTSLTLSLGAWHLQYVMESIWA